MTSKTRLLLQMQNGRKITFHSLSVPSIGKTSFLSHFRFFFAAYVMPKGSHVMASLPQNPVSCQILLWRQLQRREHTSLSMGFKKSALKLWGEIVSFYFKIPLQKRINAIDEVHYCPQDSKKVSHVSQWCFLNDLMDIEPDSNLADILLF